MDIFPKLELNIDMDMRKSIHKYGNAKYGKLFVLLYFVVNLFISPLIFINATNLYKFLYEIFYAQHPIYCNLY